MEPQASRPSMPGYGILPSDEGHGLLDWEWASERLIQTREYWLATVRRNGRPHVMPVWGVLLADQILFSVGPQSQKAKNLKTNSAVVITSNDGYRPVIVEGTADEVVANDRIERFAAAMQAKYASGHDLDFYAANATFAATPVRVFGVDGDDFTGSATRWDFTIS